MERVIACPNCDEPSFTIWQKQVLAPGRKKRCRRCGAMVSVSWVHFIPQLLLGAAFPIAVIIGLLEFGIAGGVGSVLLILLVGGIYQHYFVSLVVRSTSE